MNEPLHPVEHDAQVDLGPPAKFDAEPSRRPSKRWIFVLLSVFVGIVAAVGIVVWQGKAYLANLKAERAVKEKQSQEASAMPRTRKLFDLEAPQATDSSPLPAGFGKAPAEVPPLSPSLHAQDVTPPPAPPAGPAAAMPPKRSMLTEVSTQHGQVDADKATAATIAAALSAAGVGNAAPGATTALPGAGADTVAGTTQPRARNVQEQARRGSGTALTATPQALAASLGNRNYLLARGAAIPCTLQTQLNSNVPGPVRCITSQDIYSDDGRVLLVEKGTGIDGEFRSTLRNGDSRIAILWNRIKTPNGVVIDIDSPAADSVGTTGVSGQVDNHWWERIGAAFLLSLVDDTVAFQIARQGAQATQSSGTSMPYTTTTNTTKNIAEKVLESTINIAPTLTKNRGERLLVMVNRDLWFDQVYEVRAR